MVILDGYVGVFFENLRNKLHQHLSKSGKRVNWINVDEALKSEVEINKLIEPFLGGDNSIFGTRAAIDLIDFYDTKKLQNISPDEEYDINIIYGIGAQLVGWDGFLIYADLPKNELQFRARAKTITNIGANQAHEIKPMYKRFYFVDWVVLNKHKQNILPEIDVFIDEQRADQISWLNGNDLRQGLNKISQNVFRVRPWFEPGA